MALEEFEQILESHAGVCRELADVRHNVRKTQRQASALSEREYGSVLPMFEKLEKQLRDKGEMVAAMTKIHNEMIRLNNYVFMNGKQKDLQLIAPFSFHTGQQIRGFPHSRAEADALSNAEITRILHELGFKWAEITGLSKLECRAKLYSVSGMCTEEEMTLSRTGDT